MEYAIETFSLTKTFSDWWGRDKVYAVNDLNLQVCYNEVFGLLGPNGSGKTTTLKMLLGLLYPTKGKFLVLGGDSTNPKISARIGFLPEESYLYRYLNARETLDFYGRLFGLSSKVRQIRIEALLEMVGLRAVANRPVGTFSKGMARRIGLAQALINDPDLLILDEPTTGLDPIGTRQIKDLILELAKRGKTILLSSHLLADVEDVCDRIAILYSGSIQCEGKVKELLQQTARRQITTDITSDSALERIKQVIADVHGECVVSAPMDKLETFFIRTVAAAQKEAKTTSGAVSTTQISDFLAAKAPAGDILDKLVSASVSRSPTSVQPPVTEQVRPVETSDSRRDEQLLRKLTEPVEPVRPEPVVKPEPVEPKAPDQRQPEQSVLDQLVDRSNTPREDKDASEESQGETGDG